MSTTPTISSDAAGITDEQTARTASVVERLIAPDAGATADTIVHVPVKFVVPHPRNRKILDDDVADLVDEFKAGMPILNPLGVTAAADWNANRPADLKDIGPLEFIITAGGHRRLRAAELAGLKTVPCIVRADFAGAEGRKAALLENLHRQDLDPFEEAEAFAELVGEPYKLSQRDLAGIVGVNQSHISKRLKLLKLPSTIRAHVTVGKLHIGDAVELARVADEPKLLKEALEKVRDWRWDGKRAVDRVIEDAEANKAVADEVERLTAAGVAVLDREPSYSFTATSREPCRLDALGIKTAQHKKEPCHAARVRANYNGKVETTYACTQPKRHVGAKAESTVKATKKASTTNTVSDAEKAAKRRKTELKKTVEPARRAIVTQLVQNGFDSRARRDIITRSVIFRTYGGYSTTDSDLVVDLLNIRPGNERAYLPDVIRAHAENKPDDVALAGAVAYFEGRAADCSQWSPWGEVVRWWLDLLAANGYVITEAEHEQMRDVRNADGTWTAPADSDGTLDAEDGPTCRVCFAFLDDLPNGVTQVAADLCSACSDATDAGWVAEETPVAEAVAG